MDLGKNIKEIRISKGFNLIQVASALGVSDIIVFNWENGIEPEARYIVELADFFGCTTDDLFGRKKSVVRSNNAGKLSMNENEILGINRALSEDDKLELRSIIRQFAIIKGISCETRSIEINDDKLTGDEIEILAVYRALNKDGKTAFLSTVKNLATLYNAAVKIN